nr:H-NS family nucleoid-associated regulatory protein [Burkholderia cepacia]
MKILILIRNLESRIAEERRVVIEVILPEIKYCVRNVGFAPEDIFTVDILRRATTRLPRYFDPVSGATWPGVGRASVWIRDTDRRQFEISSQSIRMRLRRIFVTGLICAR